MKKEIKVSLAIAIGIVPILALEKPISKLLIIVLSDEQITEQIASIASRLVLACLLYYLIKKFRLLTFTGLNSWRKANNLQAVFIAAALILMGIIGNLNIYINAGVSLVFLFGISCFTVGVAEEFAFRGIIFPLLMKSFKESKKPIIISAILSSLIFGLLHYLNLFHQPDNFDGITSQVIFAIATGVFFSGLMVRTENILIPCILHSLVNFSFGAARLKQELEATAIEQTILEENSSIEWASLIPTALLFSFIFAGGIYMILSSNREVILEKTEEVVIAFKTVHS